MAIEDAARVVLKQMGAPLTPKNIQRFIENNRVELIRQVQGGGGSDDR